MTSADQDALDIAEKAQGRRGKTSTASTEVMKKARVTADIGVKTAEAVESILVTWPTHNQDHQQASPYRLSDQRQPRSIETASTIIPKVSG